MNLGMNLDTRNQHLVKLAASRRRHRMINSAIGLCVLALLILSMVWANLKFAAIDADQRVETEIAQLVMDEGYRRCIYNDSVDLPTIGFGHLITNADAKLLSKGNCISPQAAVELLRTDYGIATRYVDRDYKWAEEEVRLVLINMTYQLGAAGVSRFRLTLSHLEEQAYDSAAMELLNSKWAMQTPTRASRLAGRIMGLNTAHYTF